MSDEINGLVVEKGPFKGKIQCGVRYSDGCIGLASASFEVGDVVRSVIVPLADGKKHEHDIVGKVPSGKKPATLVNQQKDHEIRKVSTQVVDVEEYEFPMSPSDRAALQAITSMSQRDDDRPSGKPANPFSDSFNYSERPTPEAAGPRRGKPRSAWDDPRG